MEQLRFGSGRIQSSHRRQHVRYTADQPSPASHLVGRHQSSTGTHFLGTRYSRNDSVCLVHRQSLDECSPASAPHFSSVDYPGSGHDQRPARSTCAALTIHARPYDIFAGNRFVLRCTAIYANFFEIDGGEIRCPQRYSRLCCF